MASFEKLVVASVSEKSPDRSLFTLKQSGRMLTTGNVITSSEGVLCSSVYDYVSVGPKKRSALPAQTSERIISLFKMISYGEESSC